MRNNKLRLRANIIETTTEAMPVSYQLLFIGEQLNNKTYDMFLSGAITPGELREVYNLLSEWSKLSQIIVEKIEYK